ncbi:MAG: ParA family protein [Polyangiaceae bacterium]|nr:ParA family protein [Polyangiaceae bacterium]
MTIPIAFFNNRGGVGTTALVSHLAWMFAERGVPVLAADLDPQSNLTSMFVTDDRIRELWDQKLTVYAGIARSCSTSMVGRFPRPIRTRFDWPRSSIIAA